MNKPLAFQVVILFISVAFLLGSVVLRKPMEPVQHEGLLEIEEKYQHLNIVDDSAFQLDGTETSY